MVEEGLDFDRQVSVKSQETLEGSGSGKPADHPTPTVAKKAVALSLRQMGRASGPSPKMYQKLRCFVGPKRAKVRPRWPSRNLGTSQAERKQITNYNSYSLFKDKDVEISSH